MIAARISGRVAGTAGYIAFAALAFFVGAGVAVAGARAAAIPVAATVVLLMVVFNRQATIATFAALPLSGLQAPGVDLPVSELAIVALLLATAVSGRRPDRRMPTWFVASLITLVVVFTLSAILNGSFSPEGVIRLGHIGVYAALAFSLAVGFIDRKPVALGLLVGLVLATVVGLSEPILGFAEERYGGRLVGLFGDPNVAGFYLAVLGPLALGAIARPRARWVTAAVFGAAILATQSRTALVAVAVASLWVLFRRKFSLSASIAVFLVVLAGLSLVPSDITQSGVFDDRQGTDILRSEIGEQSLNSIRSALVLGHGPGTAQVLIYERFNFRFHNSYLAMVQEGGLVALGAFSLVFFGAIARVLRSARRHIDLEFAFIAVLVVSLSLGEALLELPTAVLIGFAMSTPIWATRAPPVVARPAGRLNRPFR